MRRGILTLIVLALGVTLTAAIHGQRRETARLYPIAQNWKWGFIDNAGKVVIEPQFLEAHGFSDGLAAVKPLNNAWWGYIDETGKLIIQPVPSSFMAGEFSEGLAPVGIHEPASVERVGYIDKTGKFVISPQFDKAYAFSGGLARVQYDGKYGFIDRAGKFVLDPVFDDACDFADGVASVKIGSRLGYVNARGEYIWKPSK